MNRSRRSPADDSGRVGEEYLRQAALRYDGKHPGFVKLLDGFRGKNHRGVMLAPGHLGGNDLAANGASRITGKIVRLTSKAEVK